MISGVPLFRGRDNQDQLLHIMRIIGTPDDRALRKLAQDSVGLPLTYYLCVPLTQAPLHSLKLQSNNIHDILKYLSSKYFPKLLHKVNIISNHLLPQTSHNLSRSAIDLLEHLLQFDPSKRVSATDALSHPYFTGTVNSVPYGIAPPGSMPPPSYNYPHPHGHQQQQQPQQQAYVHAQPGMGQHQHMGPPNMGQPSMGQPTMGQSNMGQPNIGQPTMYAHQDAARYSQAAQAMAQAQAAHAQGLAQAQAGYGYAPQYGQGGR
jgi:serine/threonine protein kinase